MASGEWTERTRLIITLAVVLVINGGAWGYVYKLHNDFVKLETARKNLQAQVVQLEAKADQKVDKQAELDKLRRENERQLKKLPDIRDQERFVDELTALALRSNVKINGQLKLDLDRTATIPGLGVNFRKDIYTAKYTADFQGLCEFMNSLEEFHRWFVAIEGVVINAASGGLNVTGAKHDVSFSVVTYRYVK